MAVVTLTQSAIKRLSPGEFIADSVVPGLRVQAYDRMKKYIYRYNDASSGKQKQTTIADAAVMSIAEAREHVAALKRARASGRDPRQVLGEKVIENIVADAHGAYTIKDLIDDYAAALARTERGHERERALRHDLKKWYGRPAADVRAKDVRELVAAICARAPDTSGRVLREMRSAYRLAVEHERLPDGTNPALMVKAPKESRYQPRERAFSEGEWKAWLRWLPKSGMSRDVRDALLLSAFTAQRTGEVVAAKWTDIDLAHGVWTIPKRKKRRDGSGHTVFLSKPAIAILKARANGKAFVFPSPTVRESAIAQKALGVAAYVAQKQGCPVAAWTVHDIRRSAVTALAGMQVPDNVLRRIVGHYSMRSPLDIYNRASYDEPAKAALAKLAATLTKWGAK